GTLRRVCPGPCTTLHPGPARRRGHGIIRANEVSPAGSGGCASGVSEWVWQAAPPDPDEWDHHRASAPRPRPPRAIRESGVAVVQAPDQRSGRVAAPTLPAWVSLGRLRVSVTWPLGGGCPAIPCLAV